VLSYNFFLRRVKSVGADLEEFAHDFVNLAQRATYRVEHPVKPSDVRNNGNQRAWEHRRVADGAAAVAQERSTEHA
jgi:biopolymer transport protein ExbB